MATPRRDGRSPGGVAPLVLRCDGAARTTRRRLILRACDGWPWVLDVARDAFGPGATLADAGTAAPLAMSRAPPPAPGMEVLVLVHGAAGDAGAKTGTQFSEQQQQAQPEPPQQQQLQQLAMRTGAGRPAAAAGAEARALVPYNDAPDDARSDVKAVLRVASSILFRADRGGEAPLEALAAYGGGDGEMHSRIGGGGGGAVRAGSDSDPRVYTARLATWGRARGEWPGALAQLRALASCESAVAREWCLPGDAEVVAAWVTTACGGDGRGGRGDGAPAGGGALGAALAAAERAALAACALSALQAAALTGAPGRSLGGAASVHACVAALRWAHRAGGGGGNPVVLGPADAAAVTSAAAHVLSVLSAWPEGPAALAESADVLELLTSTLDGGACAREDAGAVVAVIAAVVAAPLTRVWESRVAAAAGAVLGAMARDGQAVARVFDSGCEVLRAAVMRFHLPNRALRGGRGGAVAVVLDGWAVHAARPASSRRAMAVLAAIAARESSADAVSRLAHSTRILAAASVGAQGGPLLLQAVALLRMLAHYSHLARAVAAAGGAALALESLRGPARGTVDATEDALSLLVMLRGEPGVMPEAVRGGAAGMTVAALTASVRTAENCALTACALLDAMMEHDVDGEAARALATRECAAALGAAVASRAFGLPFMHAACRAVARLAESRDIAEVLSDASCGVVPEVMLRCGAESTDADLCAICLCGVNILTRTEATARHAVVHGGATTMAMLQGAVRHKRLRAVIPVRARRAARPPCVAPLARLTRWRRCARRRSVSSATPRATSTTSRR